MRSSGPRPGATSGRSAYGSLRGRGFSSRGRYRRAARGNRERGIGRPRDVWRRRTQSAAIIELFPGARAPGQSARAPFGGRRGRDGQGCGAEPSRVRKHVRTVCPDAGAKDGARRPRGRVLQRSRCSSAPCRRPHYSGGASDRRGDLRSPHRDRASGQSVQPPAHLELRCVALSSRPSACTAQWRFVESRTRELGVRLALGARPAAAHRRGAWQTGQRGRPGRLARSRRPLWLIAGSLGDALYLVPGSHNGLALRGDDD